ncbi:MAG: ammonium transporter [Verrucomicrobiia bacterium]|jgi:Amt family ammonium transporter|tara:strand:- start:30 stop:1457 length:1428 start_codon:yes stop_codon:yes gene_type:complete
MKTKLASSPSLATAPWKFFLLLAALLFTYAIPVHADNHEEADPAESAPTEEKAGPVDDYNALLEAQGEYAPAYDFFTTSMLWTVIAAALVFLMHLGFATLESGLCQQKNVVNVLFKNVFIISIGVITYALFGFNTHYPGEFNGWFSWGGMIGDLNADGGNTWGYGGLSLAMTGFGDFIFQAMFAATGATIVSGAVAERVKLGSFMIFAVLFVGVAYPVAGSWHWGGGYLSTLDIPFKDFAGSTVVHAFGGFGALACVMVLGPRKGKYTENGIRPIPAHSFPLAAIGVFLLMFGWYGFNGGSVLSAEPGALGLVFTTTTLGACAGALGAITTSWFLLKKPDLSMALNGLLAGLVGITANADVISVGGAIAIGAIAGIIVVFSIIFFDKAKIDDPVGAISVHGVCGVWGTIAVALFGTGDFSMATQIQGAFLVSAFAFVFAFIVFSILKAIMGVRVSEEEEERGLDITEHGQEAYTS